MRYLPGHIVLLLLPAFFLLPTVPARAQVDSTRGERDSAEVVTADPPRGSAGTPDSTGRPTRQIPAPGVYVMTKDPMTATLLSIIPGAGQIYTEQYLKAPLFFGVAAFFAGSAIYYHSRFSTFADQYDALAPGSSARSTVKANREFNRDNRDQNIAYFVGVEILSMIDAYVGAHLFDFDVDETPGRDADGARSKIYIDPVDHRVGFWLRF